MLQILSYKQEVAGSTTALPTIKSDGISTPNLLTLVRANFISKQQHDFGSILKFIEVTFSLPSLGYADVPADAFSDCFDFNQTPLTFKTITAPYNAQYFLNDKTSPTDPDDD